jgi:hypothetical protein
MIKIVKNKLASNLILLALLINIINKIVHSSKFNVPFFINSAIYASVYLIIAILFRINKLWAIYPCLILTLFMSYQIIYFIKIIYFAPIFVIVYVLQMFIQIFSMWIMYSGDKKLFKTVKHSS